MKKYLSSFLIALVLLTGISRFALADAVSVNLTVKNNGEMVYSGSVALPPAGTISINDSSGNPHDTNADSVLSVVNTADASSGEFNISNLMYYDAFSAFYLKCINVSGSDLCDNWQYKVNDVSPDVGMDSKILSGGENIVLYFGDENKPPEVVNPPVHHGGGGSYIRPLPEILPPPVVPIVTIVPPVTPEPAPLPPTTNLEKEIKLTPPPAPKKETKKINKIAKQNTATVANAVPTPPAPTPTETPKRNWFLRLLNTIFGVF